jgi:hypothetical protein
MLLKGHQPGVHSNIKSQNHLSGKADLHIYVASELRAPTIEALRSGLQFKVESVEGVWLFWKQRPCSTDHIQEAIHLRPKGLKLESSALVEMQSKPQH